MLRKKRNDPKLAALRQRAVLIALIFPLLGANQRGPIDPIFDRFAMSITGAQLRESIRRRARCYVDAIAL